MRIHLFEIEDFKEYPSFLRELQTDYLRKLMNIFNVYQSIIPLFNGLIKTSSSSTIIDFCSGGGGSWMKILPQLESTEIKVMLTDLYPNTTAFRELQKKHPNSIEYTANPVNALSPPVNLKGIRTFFNSFHHFTESEARDILRSTVANKDVIAIFEPMEKSLLQWILNTISTLLLTFFITPFISPFRWDRIIFTYLIPIVPLVTTFDGWVSILRLHTPESMMEMTRELNEEYEWQTGKASHRFGKVTYLMGRPKKKAE